MLRARPQTPDNSSFIRPIRPMRRLPIRMLSAVYTIMLALASVFGVGLAMPTTAAAAPSSTSQIYFGLVYPNAPDIPTLQAKEAQLQHGMSLMLWYQDWVEGGQQQPFPVAKLDAVRAHGSIPVLAWYPADSAALTPNQPAFTLARIIDGNWDSYIRQYATQVKAWGHPFFLRFASEMNGSWTSWSEMSNGNQRGQYVRAWRHVHDIFTQVGASNATWTWCPNTEDATTTPLDGLYPGSAYVDWACMDGYNFGPDLGGAPWRSFSAIFRGTYEHILGLIPSTMPIMIGEMASSEHGGSKPEWIKDGLTVQLPSQFPRVKGVIWFDSTNPGLDLRIDTSPQSLDALRGALATGTYVGNSYRYLDHSPIPPPGGVAPKSSTPPVLHDVTSPAAGYVQVLDSTQNAPIPNARLVYEARTSPATDELGLVILPDNPQQITLKAIDVGGGALEVSLVLDRSSGYQIRIDVQTGEVTSIRVHDPPPSLPPMSPASAIAELKAAPRSFAAMIGMAGLTLFMAVILLARLGVYALARRGHSRRRRTAAIK